jgi:predicted peptidase
MWCSVAFAPLTSPTLGPDQAWGTTMKSRLNRVAGSLVVVVHCLSGPLLAQAPATAAPPQWVTPAANVPRLQHRTFDSKAAGTRVSYHIYTPAVYDREPSRRFPVMYWLHGSNPWVPPGLVTNVDART